MRYSCYLCAIFLLFCSCHNLQKKSEFELKNGDLLFQDLDNDSLSEAIETVTGGAEQLNFSHVGMVVDADLGKKVVLEAISKGVCLTPLDTFLNRSRNAEGKPKVVVGRLKEKFRERIPQAIVYGKGLIGKSYDHVYVMGDSCFYCSELIFEMMQHSGDASTVFELNPMTFKNPETGEFLAAWVEYYQTLGVPIPEGQPGLNPNGMSRSGNIELIYNFATRDKAQK